MDFIRTNRPVPALASLLILMTQPALMAQSSWDLSKQICKAPARRSDCIFLFRRIAPYFSPWQISSRSGFPP